MNIIKPSFKIEHITPDALQLIERAGRTCYKSEDKITPESAKTFARMIMKRGHLSVIEHSQMTVRIICDRGVTHEIVRHRLAAYSQESTRYCNYKGGVTFVIPPWVDIFPGEYNTIEELDRYGNNLRHDEIVWCSQMLSAETDYICLIEDGWTPQQARTVLPNSLKTEIVITANFREWRHIFKLRTDLSAHPQMQEIMRPLLKEAVNHVPVIFDNIAF